MLSRSIVSDSLQPHGVGSFSMGLSRQEYWSGLPFPPPGDLPIQQSNLGLRCLLHCRHVPYQWTTGEASFSTTFILSFSVTFFFFNSAVPGLRCSTQDLSSSIVACGIFFSFVVVQSLHHVWLFATLWIAALQASLSFTISWSVLKLMSIESKMPLNHLILCRPLLLPSIFPSIRVFSDESVLRIRWPKYWSFSFSISPSNWYSGLISFRIDCFDLLAVQGTLKSLLQHHSSKASIFWHSAFFMVRLSHPYMTPGKTIACGSQQTVENSGRDGNTKPPFQTCLLTNLYAGQEATVRNRHRT